jgi:hypothetical protein
MPPGKGLSAMEKVKTLTSEREETRLAEENQRRQAEEEKEQLAFESHTKEKTTFDQMAERKKEIEQELGISRNEKGVIVQQSREAVRVIKNEPELEKAILENKRYREIFSGERDSLNELRKKINDLTGEKSDIEVALPEKQQEIDALYAETKEGKIAAVEKAKIEEAERIESLTKEFISSENIYLYINIDNLKKGNWSSGVINNLPKLARIPEAERQEVVDAIKTKLHGEVERQYASRNKGNLSSVIEDAERIKKYEKDRVDVARELNDFRHEANEYVLKYKDALKDDDNPIARSISKYFGSTGERRDFSLAYLSEGIDSTKLHDIGEELMADITKASLKSAPDTESIRKYVEGARKKNEALLAAIESNDTELIQKAFSGNGDPDKFFGVEGYTLSRNLRNKVPLVRHEVSLVHKTPKDIVEYADAKTKEQQIEKEKINAFTDASIDLDVIVGETQVMNTSIYMLDSEAKQFKAEQEDVEKALLNIENSYARLHNIKDEILVYSIDEIGYPFNVPITQSQANKILEENKEITLMKKEVDFDQTAYYALSNKGPAFLEKRKTYEDRVKKAEEELVQKRAAFNKKQEEYYALLNKRDPNIELLWKSVFKIDHTPGYSDTMTKMSHNATVTEMLDRLKVMFTEKSQKQFPEEKQQVLEKAHIAQTAAAEAKKRLLTA